MSLLENITLAYETLADDPIEKGIHYGHSVLEALSTKLVPHIPEPVVETASTFSYNLPVEKVSIQKPLSTRQFISRGITSMPSRLENQDSAIYRMRRTAVGYSSRNVANQSRGYSRRPLLGAL